MSTIVISVENVSKYYRLGLIGGRTLHDDFERWLAKVRGKPDPLLKIGQEDQGNRKGEYIWALRDVRFDVHQGEVLGIIGRNGAGKSTLLKILSRVTAPTSGQVKVKGRVASLLEVGTGFHPELTGRENIYLNGAILGMKSNEINRKLDEIVDFAEIDKFIDTPVKRYSSGMYVRLAFSIAAHLEPEILIVDEVLAVGDVSFQKKSAKKMRDVSTAGRTVVFVSHNLLLIRAMCTTCLLLEKGRLITKGDPNSVVQEYLSTQYTTSLFRRIEEADHAYGIGKVRVNTVAIVDEKGEVIKDIKYHQPIQVQINLDVISHVPAGKFSLCIMTMEDARIIMTHSIDNDDDYHELLPGRYIVNIQLFNGLKPGDYKLEFGGHYLPSTISLCHIPDALRFRISEDGFTPGDRAAFCNRNSLVDGHCKWELQFLTQTG